MNLSSVSYIFTFTKINCRAKHHNWIHFNNIELFVASNYFFSFLFFCLLNHGLQHSSVFEIVSNINKLSFARCAILIWTMPFALRILEVCSVILLRLLLLQHCKIDVKYWEGDIWEWFLIVVVIAWIWNQMFECVQVQFTYHNV